MTNFGNRVRMLREAKQMTQGELGKIIEQSKHNVSRYENGKVEPSLETVKKIAQYFRVSTDFLLANTHPVEIDIDKYKVIIHRWVREGKTARDIENDEKLLSELKDKIRKYIQ